MTKNNKFVGLIIIVVIAFVIGGLTLTKNNKEDNTQNSTSATTNSETSTNNLTTSSSNSTGTYKDGTYSSNGQYESPGGDESIDVSLTIKDGKIESSTVAAQAASRESMEYQDDFESNYKKQVIGKDISTLKIGKVAGSSLTSQGFNDALDKIRNQAKI